MTQDPVRPDDLAAAIADGRSVDWATLAAHAATPEARARVFRFRLLARVADAHALQDDSEPGRVRILDPELPDYRRGDHWGTLRIVERLAAGTFGTVYRAHDAALARDVALKILRMPAPADEAALEAVREGRLLARIRHPHVVAVYGAEQRDGRVGLWMELIEGRTLEDELGASGPFAVEDVAAIGRDLGRALDAVHSAGLLHRDVKAQNVMRDARDGRLVLMDFSAGREQADVAPADAAWPASLVGSPPYLAPELLDGARASVGSDIYGLGVLLYRLLTGRFPVEGSTLAEIERAHRERVVAPIRDARPETPDWLALAIARSLAVNPSDRQATGQVLAVELTRGAVPIDSRRRRLLMTMAALATVTAIAAGSAVWQRHRPAPIAFAARDWVLIADFENRTGDRSFDDVLEQALTRELTASRHVNVVPRARVEDALTLMQLPLDAPLDARRAREVSLRDGRIRAVLSGRMARVGAAYVLTTEIGNPTDGAVHQMVQAEVTDVSALLPAVRDQAFRVREALGEGLPALQRSRQELARVTTPSLLALQLYSRAATLLEGEAWLSREDVANRYETADKLLADATRIDPTFASAWALRARAAAAANRLPAEALSYAARATALAPQSTPEERYFIEGLAYRVQADGGPFRRAELERAAQAFETLVHLVPDHYWTLIELEAVYRRLGRRDDAERTALRAAELRPTSIHFAAVAAAAHLRRRDTAALRRVAVHALSLVPAGLEEAGGNLSRDIGWLRMWEARDAWMAGDAHKVDRLLADLEVTRGPSLPPFLRNEFVHASHGLGQFDDARRLAEAGTGSQREFFLTMADARQDRWKVLRPTLRARQGEWPYVNRFSFIYVWGGLLDRAEWLVAQRRRQTVTRDWQSAREFEGMLRVAQGRHAEAMALFAPILADEQFPRLRMHEYVGRALAGLGDTRGAIVHLERFERDPMTAMTFGWAAYDWLRCLTLLAELYRDAGMSADAARVAAQVRAHLVLADQDNPFAARLARLP